MGRIDRSRSPGESICEIHITRCPLFQASARHGLATPREYVTIARNWEYHLIAINIYF
jgi:hypothetical protein